MSKRICKAGWFIISCFFLFTACSTPKQKMLRQKWHLNAVAVTQPVEGSLLDNDSSAQAKHESPKVITDTVRTEGSTDFFDFSDSKNYSAQLMGSATNGAYLYNETTGQIIRHNETTGVTDTIDIKKLSPDTLILFEKENRLTMFLVTTK